MLTVRSASRIRRPANGGCSTSSCRARSRSSASGCKGEAADGGRQGPSSLAKRLCSGPIKDYLGMSRITARLHGRRGGRRGHVPVLPRTRREPDADLRPDRERRAHRRAARPRCSSAHRRQAAAECRCAHRRSAAARRDALRNGLSAVLIRIDGLVGRPRRLRLWPRASPAGPSPGVASRSIVARASSSADRPARSHRARRTLPFTVGWPWRHDPDLLGPEATLGILLPPTLHPSACAVPEGGSACRSGVLAAIRRAGIDPPCRRRHDRQHQRSPDASGGLVGARSSSRIGACCRPALLSSMSTAPRRSPLRCRFPRLALAPPWPIGSRTGYDSGALAE